MSFDPLSFIIGKQSATKESGKYATYEKISFTATGISMTVEHGCGQVPDMIIILPTSIPSVGELCVSVGFSKAVFDKFETQGHYAPTSFVMSAVSGLMIVESDINFEVPQEEFTGLFGVGICGVTDSVFSYGNSKTQYGLIADHNYVAFCYCNLV